MKNNTLYNFASFFILVIVIASCNNEPKHHKQTETTAAKQEVYKQVSPVFNADSAYYFVQQQVNFGPRVTNSEPHKQCGNWLVKELKKYCDQVIEQKTTVVHFDNTKLNVRNIIGVINPKAENRILLCAHWDSRPFADQDAVKKDEPILGANDGASGVGVLMQIAQTMKTNPSSVGVDIVLFDAEDLGKSEHENSFCLGSQYWSANPHKPNYKASFGILLDMVGAPGATFAWEEVSIEAAQPILQQVWQLGHQLGYSNYFMFYNKGGIIDDHYYVNKIAKIPTIDIIHYDASSPTGFPRHWHTHQDNMSAIDKTTLKAVGQTLLELIYTTK
jgi:glutaminyl-peptide cyclotransferase